MSAVQSAVEFTSHEWIVEVDVPTAVVITTADQVVPLGRQRGSPAPSRMLLCSISSVTRRLSQRPGTFRSGADRSSRTVTGAIAGLAVEGEPA